MKRKVQIYIESVQGSENYVELELFEDEKIEINLSVQNVQDISKVFTDFSQSFNVPASIHNNNIFQHFYENSIDSSEIDGVTTTINVNVRRNAFIEVGLTPFRTGRIELERALVKNGKVDSYQITFYGDLVSLKDKLANYKLSDLDLSSLDFTYSGTEVKNRITNDSTDYDIRFPLISSEKFWSYGDSSSTDISNSSHPINHKELFPAIRVKKIFEAIETKLGITFNSLFFSDNRFHKLFLWCKNKLTNTTTTDSQSIHTNQTTSLMDGFLYGTFTNYDYGRIYLANQIPIGSNAPFGARVEYEPKKNELYIKINSLSDITIKYYIDVYYKDTNYTTAVPTELLQTYEQVGYPTNGIILLDSIVPDISKLWVNPNRQYEVSLRADNNIVINFTIYGLYTRKETHINSFGIVTKKEIKSYPTIVNSTTLTFYQNSLIKSYMPDITLNDFITGIIKEFNLTCYGINENTFRIEPLYQWYNYGAVIDISKFIISDEIEYSKHELYKNISFKYQDSESIYNKSFEGTQFRKYGDANQVFNNNGSDYSIEVPFEDLIINEIATDVNIGYCINNENKSYIPKPILLYQNDKITKDIYFNNGTTTSNLTSYIPFTHEIKYNSQIYSLNFGVEYSWLFNQLVDNSLFATYYYSYLKNIYDFKSRLVRVKGVFPISLVTNLKMNDRLIIRDKRYIINTIKIDITTGEVDLELLTDLTPIARKTRGEINVSEDGGSIQIPIYLSEKTNITQVVNSTDFTKLIDEVEGVNIVAEDYSLILKEDTTYNSNISISQDVFTTSENINATISASITPNQIILTETSDNVITEDSLYILNESAETSVYTLTLINTDNYNTEFISYIDIIQ